MHAKILVLKLRPPDAAQREGLAPTSTRSRAERLEDLGYVFRQCRPWLLHQIIAVVNLPSHGMGSCSAGLIRPT